MAKRSVSGRKAIRAAKRRTTDEFLRDAGAEGSIAHQLALRPGGTEAALARIDAAMEAGVEKGAALRQELAGEYPTEREPVSDATKALLDAADHELLDAQSILLVMRRAFDDDDAADEWAVLGRVLRMLAGVSSAIEYATMGVPRKAALWPEGAGKEARS